MAIGKAVQISLATVIVLAVLLPAHSETVIHARLSSDIQSTDPGVRRDGNTDQVMLHIVEGLVAYREDGSVGPLLARSWSISPDGTTYTFKLRSGVYFHNDQPMTAKDVVWSLERYFNMGSRWRCADAIGARGMMKVIGVAATAPDTVVVRLDRAVPLFLATLARTDCGETGILSPASVDAHGNWIAPIGTGPFKFADWKHNQYIDLVRFDKYAALPGPRDGNTGGKMPLVDRVHFMIIPDSTAALVALLHGSLDVLGEVAYVNYDSIKHSPDLVVNVTPMEDINALFFQTQDPLLRDVRLRQAIALTLDTAGMTRVITRGTAQSNNSIVPTPSPYHKAIEAKLRGVNIAEARRLAAAAGYKGQEIHLVTNHNYPELFDSAVLAQAMAHEAGINLVIDTLDWASEMADYSSGKYQMLSFSFSARLDPAFNFQLFIGDKKLDPRKAWDSPQARALLQQLIETSDTTKRQAIVDQLHMLFMHDTPAVVTFNTSRISAYRKNVVGYKTWLTGLPRYWGVSLKK
jgi:peptide/nickel transport system substrate-binding protein